MADAERYAALADLQGMLTERPSVSAPLRRLLGSASTAVEDHCDRVFTLDASASERTFRARLSDAVSVRDIASASGVTVSVGAGSSWAALAAADWWLAPENAPTDGHPFTELFSVDRFTPGRRPSVKVSAVWGWPAVPGPVTEAVLLLASRLFSRRSSPTGVAGFGDYGAVRVTSADADVAGLLKPYVREGFGD